MTTFLPLMNRHTQQIPATKPPSKAKSHSPTDSASPILLSAYTPEPTLSKHSVYAYDSLLLGHASTNTSSSNSTSPMYFNRPRTSSTSIHPTTAVMKQISFQQNSRMIAKLNMNPQVQSPHISQTTTPRASSSVMKDNATKVTTQCSSHAYDFESEFQSKLNQFNKAFSPFLQTKGYYNRMKPLSDDAKPQLNLMLKQQRTPSSEDSRKLFPIPLVNQFTWSPPFDAGSKMNSYVFQDISKSDVKSSQQQQQQTEEASDEFDVPFRSLSSSRTFRSGSSHQDGRLSNYSKRKQKQLSSQQQTPLSTVVVNMEFPGRSRDESTNDVDAQNIRKRQAFQNRIKKFRMKLRPMQNNQQMYPTISEFNTSVLSFDSSTRSSRLMNAAAAAANAALTSVQISFSEKIPVEKYRATTPNQKNLIRSLEQKAMKSRGSEPRDSSERKIGSEDKVFEPIQLMSALNQVSPWMSNQPIDDDYLNHFVEEQHC